MADGIGPGNRESVVGQPRQAPAVSLLTSASFVTDAGDPSDTRWMNGIKYRREPSGTGKAGAWGYLAARTEVTENFTGSQDATVVKVDPFLVWVDEQASSFGFSVADYIGRAQRKLAVVEAYRVEHEFWTGVQARAAAAANINDYCQTQFLAQNTTCTTLNGGSSTSIGRAFVMLQQAIADQIGGPGFIHLPFAGLSPLLTLMLVTPLNPNQKVVTKYTDGLNNVVVPGAGYGANMTDVNAIHQYAPGTDTTNAMASIGPDGSLAVFPKFWMYGTCPVTIRREQNVTVTPDTYAQALDRTKNLIEFTAQRAYSVDAELKTCHFAVLTDASVIAGF